MPGYILVDQESLYMAVIVAGLSGLLIGWSVAMWLSDNEERIYAVWDKAIAALVAMLVWARAFFKRTGKHRKARQPRRLALPLFDARHAASFRDEATS